MTIDWLVIKSFGKVKYFNISYVALLVIPIYIDIADRIDGNLSLLPVPDSIRYIYLASFLYALGIAMYQYACPTIVKNYDRIQDYIRDNYEILLNSYPDLKYNIVSANLEKDIQKETIAKLQQLKVAADNGIKGKQKDVQELVDSFLPSCVQNYLTKEFNEALKSHRFWMITSLIFYVAGSIIVLILLIRKSLIVFNF